MKNLRTLWEEEDGMGVVEVILIIVVLISLVVIFKKQITSVVNTIMSKISKNASQV
ncbi:MAG: Flp1 family type IVb pilin [Butyrivibrio sp.]